LIFGFINLPFSQITDIVTREKMKEKKKRNRMRIVKPNSINYTFTSDVAVLSKKDDKRNKGNQKEKAHEFTKKTLKDLTATKTHYKPNRKNPKSQQTHSSVYE
jgi:hypothetical protein